MKKLIKYVFILNFCFSYSQTKITISQALNIASKQSMLCERLAKEKTFKATNHDTEHMLSASLIQFEQNISILKKMEFTEEVFSKITAVEMLWPSYKLNILNKEESTIIETIRFHDVMLLHCKDLFKSILSFSEVKNSYPYNSKVLEFPGAYISSNNLKHLWQQLSIQYNAYYSKIITYDAKKLNYILSEIDKSIVNITKIEDKDKAIKEKTTDVKTQWVDLKSTITKVMHTNFVSINNYPKPETILGKSNNLVKNTDLLTRLYKANSEIN